MPLSKIQAWFSSARLAAALHLLVRSPRRRAVITMSMLTITLLGIAPASMALVGPGPGEGTRHAKLNRLMDGDLSNRSLERLYAQMDLSMLTVARRYDVSFGRSPFGMSNALLTTDAPPEPGVKDLSASEAMLVNASVPYSSLPIRAAAPFDMKLDKETANTAYAVECMTAAVYYEAATESDEGQAAVAQVVLNRMRHPLFPKSVCGVVFQGSERITGCQFTFTCDGSLARIPDPASWARAQRAARKALSGYVAKNVGAATHYHTVWVVPYWMPSLVKLKQIGAHIFYRWDGTAGLPGAFRGVYSADEGLAWAKANPKTLKVSLALAEVPVVETARSVELHTVEAVAVANVETPAARLEAAPTVAMVQFEAPRSVTTSNGYTTRPAARLATPPGW